MRHGRGAGGYGTGVARLSLQIPHLRANGTTGTIWKCAIMGVEAHIRKALFER